MTTEEIPESDLCISVAELRRILSDCIQAGYINEYAKFRIIDLIKERL